MKHLWKSFVAWCKAGNVNHRIDTTTDGLFYVYKLGNKYMPGRAVTTKRHLTRGGAVQEALELGLEVKP